MGFRLQEEQGVTDVSIPLTATDQLYYRMADGSPRTSDDLRTLYTSDDELDEAGIYSFLQFGTVIPPPQPLEGNS